MFEPADRDGAVDRPGPAEIFRVEDLLPAFARTFNACEIEVMERLYEPDSILVPAPGVVLAGEQRRGATAALMARRVPITVHLRHTYVCGNIAIIDFDFVFDGVGSNGTEVLERGTARDVARRGADRRWRYAISAPQLGLA